MVGQISLKSLEKTSRKRRDNERQGGQQGNNRQGILFPKEKRHRLVLGVHLIQQATAVEIDTADVAPV